VQNKQKKAITRTSFREQNTERKKGNREQKTPLGMDHSSSDDQGGGNPPPEGKDRNLVEKSRKYTSIKRKQNQAWGKTLAAIVQ